MDDDEISKWEPDAISAPSKRMQNTILNPEEEMNVVSNNNTNSKKKVLVTVSVPIKIQRLWLAELSRLDDSHTIKSALQALKRLSSPDKMPVERIASFVALFAANHDHKSCDCKIESHQKHIKNYNTIPIESYNSIVQVSNRNCYISFHKFDI